MFFDSRFVLPHIRSYLFLFDKQEDFQHFRSPTDHYVKVSLNKHQTYPMNLVYLSSDAGTNNNGLKSGRR